MQVKELMALLSDMDPEARVHFAYNFGDYWRTVVAPEITLVDEGLVRHSGYHNMPRVVHDDDTADSVVLLR